MPNQLDEQRRIDLLRVKLLDLGLEWNMHYHFVDEGTRWTLDIIRIMTPEQFNRANEWLEMIVHR
jgi:hypothetical protein